MSTLPLGFFGGGDPTEVAPRTYFVPAFANSAAFETDEGLVVVDVGLAMSGPAILAGLRRLTPAPVHTIVFTHGHVDHAFGVDAFDAEARAAGRPRPRRLAHARVPARFRRYDVTRGLNAHINRVQFGVAELEWPARFPWPDVTYEEAMSFTLGGERFELRHALGETDDATWVWAPDRKVVCTGDLFIWCSPNCGNPQKVQRYAEGWADAMDAMAGLAPEVLLPGHGPAIVGVAEVAAALHDTSAWLRSIIEQTLARLNRGERPEDVARAVRPPAHLASKPYLQPLYDRPEFVVRNLARLYGGWYDGNPAHLLPAPEAARAAEIAALAGGADKLVARARALAATDLALACHLVDWATLAAPASRAAQEAKRDLFQARSADEPSLMARGIFDSAVRAAESALRQMD
ncbi:MAG: MBL fold metallo-hydrolase [Deltaproteobacteria bacterium]|nr:MBL fold metallo-hydrolase [Deltaproteobacteria bacterium]